MNAEFDRCTAYGLKAGTHPEETSEAPEATNTGGAMGDVKGNHRHGSPQAIAMGQAICLP